MRVKHVTIHSDNAAFVRAANIRLECLRNQNILPYHAHSDLWSLFEHALGSRRLDLVNILKVKAHQSWQAASTQHEAWRTWANDRADEKAKAIVKASDFFTRINSIFQAQLRLLST